MSPTDGFDDLAGKIVSKEMTREELLRRAAALGISAAGLAAVLGAKPALGASRALAGGEVNRAVSGTITVIYNAGAGVEQTAWNARTAAFTKKFPNVKV